MTRSFFISLLYDLDWLPFFQAARIIRDKDGTKDGFLHSREPYPLDVGGPEDLAGQNMLALVFLLILAF
jgi:hypothetical protein